MNLGDLLLDAAKWVGAIIVAIMAWMYKQDREEVKAQGMRINLLERGSVQRSELASEIAGIRHEIRDDITDLKNDMNDKLNILIDLHRHGGDAGGRGSRRD